MTAAYGIAKCDPISNKNFNSNIRDYAATDVNVSERRNFQNKLKRRNEKVIKQYILIAEHNKCENFAKGRFCKICNVHTGQQPN